MALDAIFDLDRLRIPITPSASPTTPAAPSTSTAPATSLPAPAPRTRRSRPPRSPLPRHQPGERFLKGPLPWTWLTLAMRQPGKALHVALAIWQHAGMANSGTIKVNLSRLDGVTHSAASRGLNALERAGLVTVLRQKGQSPEL